MSNDATTVWLRDEITRFNETMNRLERGLDVQVTSSWRSPAHNVAVGGAPWSQHQFGLARDYVGPDIGALAELADAEGFVTVPGVDSGVQYLHVQALPAGTLQERLGPVPPAFGVPVGVDLTAQNIALSATRGRHIPLGRTRVVGCIH